jgi:hypothetical protein
MLGVTTTDFVQDSIAVEIMGVGAGARFEMMSYTCCGCKGTLAKGTDDIGASMDAGVEMLANLISIV